MGKEPVGIVHGDYRIGNVILHPTEPRVISVLVRTNTVPTLLRTNERHCVRCFSARPLAAFCCF